MNFNDEAVLLHANNIAVSVQVAVDPSSDGQARLQAHQFLEDFRTKASPTELCTVGLLLTRKAEEPVIRAGLQLVEYVAKYHWNTLVNRQQVKDSILQLMQNGLNSGSAVWPSYLQEALSKVIVEIAKREWPQLWPDLFPKLFQMASVTDLALLVLRRMAEDVVTLQLIDCVERRRELSQSLNAIAPEVITTLYNVLISSVQQYNLNKSEASKRRGKVCLGCLLPYLEWLNPLIFTQDNRIPILFALLPETEFQNEAADCIIQVLERKPLKKEDKYEVPKTCLENESCIPLIRSIDKCVDNLDFLRKTGEIVSLIAPCVVEGKVNVANFFTCTLKLVNKPHAIAVLGGAIAINQYIKVQNLNTDLTDGPTGKSLTCVLNAICNKFVFGPPLLHEKDELARLKTEFSQMLRSIGKCLPKLYKEVNTWLLFSLSSPDTVPIHHWETLVLVIDAVASSISHEDKEMVEIGLRDLENCYTKFKDEISLERKSIILSTVSALFVFLALSKRSGSFNDSHLVFMHSILESVFHCFNYENVTYARDIRRHAAALMIKLSTKYPDLMGLSFNYIHSTTTALASKLSSMEYTTLMESLLITCNSWNDVLRQSEFIASLLHSSEWERISIDSESLENFVLILQEPVFQDKRILFLKNLTILNCIIRRVKRLNKTNNGVLQQSRSAENSNDNAVSRSTATDFETVHPAYDSVCPLLPIVLKLVKTLHSLLDDPQLAFLIDLSDQEKAHIMGIHFSGGAHTATGEPIPASVIGNDSEKSHPDKLKLFIQSLIDLTYGILGGTPGLFAPKFYSIPQVAEVYLSFVGWNSIKMNDFRLRGVIRTIFAPFLLNCPVAQCDDVVKPFLQKFCPFILDRLVNRWTAIENAKVSGEDAEEQEVLENTSLRLLSKDYIDLIHKLLEAKINNGPLQVNGAEFETDTMITEVADSSEVHNSVPGDDPGECGAILLADAICFQYIIHMCIQALCWDDSNVCLKACRCILLSWKKISEHTDIVRATFGTVLRALCLWYENEANMDCLFKVLDVAFKSCHQSDPTLSQMLREWGANDVDIQKLIGLCNGVKNEKKRKDLLRRMVANNPALEKNRSPKAQWLRGLPQLNFNKSKDSKNTDIDLSECFSGIHHL